MKENVRLRNALLLGRGACTEPGCTYAPEVCPRYWRRVFVSYFGNEPESDQDLRWDELFKEGMPLHRTLREHEAKTKAAS